MEESPETVVDDRWTVLVSSKEPNAQDLVGRLEAAGIRATRHDVPLCDIVFVLGGKTFVQAELKSQRDLLASITVDCRYHEQTASMSVSGVPYTFYLVHGYRPGGGVFDAEQCKLEHAITRVQLSGSLNAATQSGRTHIGLVPLTSQDGVFSWIQYVHKNLVEDPVLTDGVLAPLTENVKHAFGTKPANRGQARVYVEQISRITGIADEKAKVLAKAFPTMCMLLDFLRGCETPKEIVKRLSAMKVGLGKKAAEMLYTQLLSAEEQKFVF
jgi:hypothetical protein